MYERVPTCIINGDASVHRAISLQRLWDQDRSCDLFGLTPASNCTCHRTGGAFGESVHDVEHWGKQEGFRRLHFPDLG